MLGMIFFHKINTGGNKKQAGTAFIICERLGHSVDYYKQHSNKII